MMRFRFKLDKKGIPAFILILLMMFQSDPSDAEQTAVNQPADPFSLALVDEQLVEIVPFENDLVLDEANLPTLINIVAQVESPDVQGVQFLLDERELRLDDDPPFTVADEETGWQMPEAGEHQLTVIPLTALEEEAVASGEPLTITFSVADEPSPADDQAP